MAEKKTTPVVIDGIEYTLEAMTDNQRTLLDHVADLDRKLNSTRFNLDQLQVGRDTFFAMLKRALEDKDEAEQPAEATA